MMDRDTILALAPGTKEVATLAWGPVHVRQLRADELPALLGILDTPPGAARLAAFCVLGCVTPEGAPLFQPGDEASLIAGPLEPLSEAASAFLAFNGVDGVTDPEAEKKSASDPSNSSLTVLPTAGAFRNRP